MNEKKKISNSLYSTIYEKIDRDLMDDNLDWSYANDLFSNESYDSNVVQFSGKKYNEGDEGNLYFQYVKKEYYENVESEAPDLTRRWLNKSPILELFETPLYFKWTNLFGELWRPVFMDWFRTKYPQFPVRTFLFSNLDF